MAIRATFASPAMTTVNLWIDADSVRPGLPVDGPEVTAFVSGGGVIDAYEAPPSPPTASQIDSKVLNDALIAEGSVVRALGLVMFAEINKLRVKTGDPAYTLAQFKAALQAQMRAP